MNKKLTFVNGAKAGCGCRHEFSSGGGEYSDVASVHLCAMHAGTPVLDDRWKARMLDGRAPERDEMGFGNHPELPSLDEGMMPRSFFAALGLELAHTRAEDQLDGDALEAMSEAVNWTGWTPTPPPGDGWKLVSIFDTEDGPAAWWLRELPEAEDGTTTIRNLQAEVEKLTARIARAGAAPAAVAPASGDIDWDVLTEDPSERAMFDRNLGLLYGGDPRVPIATSLRIWAQTNGNGSFGAQCAVYANEVAKMHVAPPALEAPAAPTVKYVPVDSRLRDSDWRHPNDTEPRTHDCLAALRERGDDEGQGLDNYWKWGFAAGFNAALAAAPQAPAAPVAPAATMFHDAGAIAQCTCGRYTLNRNSLSPRDERRPVCECGTNHGWSGSFKKPGADSKWHGPAPAPAAPAASPAAPAVDARDTARMNWLEAQVVNVRAPLRYGSRDLFWASPEEVDGGPDGPSDLRARIDAAQAAAKGEHDHE